MQKAKVFFTPHVSAEGLPRLYRALEHSLPSPVAVKIHSGEPGNQNFLGPSFMRPIIEEVNGTAVECNTAYRGGRDTTEAHMQTLQKHGWLAFPFDLLDGEGEDLVLDIPNGNTIKKNYVGAHLSKYKSMLVLSHFKGHPMGGYGGALKQLSIGIASSYGKKYIHGAGEPAMFWDAKRDAFLSAMADAASSVVQYFQGNMAFINVMSNLSVDCDCCAVAEDPCMQDIGMLASLDPVALDKACLDLIYASSDPGRDHMVERIETRLGAHTIKFAVMHGIGSEEYELIRLEE